MPKGNKAVKNKPLLEDMENEEYINPSLSPFNTIIPNTSNKPYYPEDDERQPPIIKSTDTIDTLVSLNTNDGYKWRRNMGPAYYGITGETNPEANEAGWIAEYWFAETVGPDYFNARLHHTDYGAEWDFIEPDFAVEVKTTVPDPSKSGPTFMIPLSKFEDRPDVDEYYIFWAVIDSFEKTIAERDSCPKKWKWTVFPKEYVDAGTTTYSDDLFDALPKKTSPAGNTTYYHPDELNRSGEPKYWFAIYEKIFTNPDGTTKKRKHLIFNEYALHSIYP